MQFLEVPLYKLGVIIEGYFWFLVKNDVNFDSSAGDLFQYVIKSAATIVQFSRPTQQKVGCYHPVSNEDILLGVEQLSAHIAKVPLPISVEFGLAVLTDWCKTIEPLLLRERTTSECFLHVSKKEDKGRDILSQQGELSRG
jgi:hypothetical protein